MWSQCGCVLNPSTGESPSDFSSSASDLSSAPVTPGSTTRTPPSPRTTTVLDRQNVLWRTQQCSETCTSTSGASAPLGPGNGGPSEPRAKGQDEGAVFGQPHLLWEGGRHPGAPAAHH